MRLLITADAAVVIGFTDRVEAMRNGDQNVSLQAGIGIGEIKLAGRRVKP